MEALAMFPKDEDWRQLKHIMETLEAQNAYLLNVVIYLSHRHDISLNPLPFIRHAWIPLLQLLTLVFWVCFLLGFLMTNISTLHSLYNPILYLFFFFLRGQGSYFGINLSQVIILFPSSLPLSGKKVFSLFGL
jgi:hypothetical protein